MMSVLDFIGWLVVIASSFEYLYTLGVFNPIFSLVLFVLNWALEHQAIRLCLFITLSIPTYCRINAARLTRVVPPITVWLKRTFDFFSSICPFSETVEIYLYSNSPPCFAPSMIVAFTTTAHYIYSNVCKRDGKFRRSLNRIIYCFHFLYEYLFVPVFYVIITSLATYVAVAVYYYTADYIMKWLVESNGNVVFRDTMNSFVSLPYAIATSDNEQGSTGLSGLPESLDDFARLYTPGGTNIHQSSRTPFPGPGRPSLLEPRYGMNRQTISSFDPAAMLVALMKIFTSAKKFSGTGSAARQAFVEFTNLLESTLRSWNSITAGLIPETLSSYTLVSVLSIDPNILRDTDGFSIAKEFSHILFRLFMHICTDSALRLISQDKKTEDGFSAYQRLKRRFANITVSTIGDLENKIQSWEWPNTRTDPQDAMLVITELWDKMGDYGLPVPETQRITFLISKMRKHSIFKQLPALWGGANLAQFLSTTSSQDIFDRVYEHWEYVHDSSADTNPPPPTDTTYATDGTHTCRICKVATCPGEKSCRERKCIRCGMKGHDISNCRTNMKKRTDGDKQKVCAKCKSSSHALKDCPKVKCHECNEMGHIRPNCPKLKDRDSVNATTDEPVSAGLERSDATYAVNDTSTSDSDAELTDEYMSSLFPQPHDSASDDDDTSDDYIPLPTSPTHIDTDDTSTDADHRDGADDLSYRPIVSLFPWLLPAIAEIVASTTRTPSYVDVDSNSLDYAASAAVVSDVQPRELPGPFIRAIRDTVSAVNHVAAVIKSFLVDSGSTRNICRNRAWFDESSFSTDSIHHITLRGIVNTSNGEVITIKTMGFGYVNLSTFLGLSNVGIDLRIACFWCPDAADDVLSTDILKQGIDFRIVSSSNSEQHTFRRVPLFFSTENDALYNETEQFVIPLRSRIKVTSVEQGTGLILTEHPNAGGNIAPDKTDTVSIILNSVTIESNELSLKPTEMTALSNKLNTKFDADILNRHTAHTYKDAMSENTKSLDTGDFVNGHYFAFPSSDESSIHQLIRTALKSYLLASLTTSFTFIVPESKKSVWWSLVSKYFDIISVIKAGDKVFQHKDKNGNYIESSFTSPMVIIHLSKNSSIHVDNWLLAHCRFNHIGGSMLNKMAESGANLGLSFKEASSFILCHVCNTCKATRPPVRDLTGKPRSRLPSPLHDLYMDIHGPINPSSTLGYRYVLGFICSATGYAFIYFLKRKSESFKCFCSLVKFLLSHKDLPVKFDPALLTLISDNAREFTSGEMKEYCELLKIKHELTSPYAHHQALFIERLWRTLADASRTMLATSGIDYKYWPLAFRHAVHVYRLLPHKTRDESTATESPHYKLFGVEGDVSHLRIFGSDAFPFIEKDARTDGKLIALRAKYGRYVGHEENLQTILILDEVRGKVYKAGLVKIVENVDAVGKIISNPNVTVASYKYAEHDSSLYELPKPFTKKQNFKTISVLSDIATFYDEDDKETYGVVKFTDKTHTDTWTLAINILFYVTTDSMMQVRDMLYALLEASFGKRTGKQNIHFPIFARVNCLHEGTLRPAIIVSTDAHSNRPYGVIFYNEDTGEVFHQDITAGDIPDFHVDILYATVDSISDPTSHRSAMARPDASLWRTAEDEECTSMFITKECLRSIMLTDIPPKTVIMPMKWVYKIKRNFDGTVERYKARLVAKGYRQLPGVHFDAGSTFSPSASSIAFRLLLAFAVTFAMHLFSMDVTAAFLNSKPKYDNYIILPEGFTYKGSPYAFMLKNIYGTRDAARGWYDDQHSYLMRTYPFLLRSAVDPCFYYSFSAELSVILLLTVDDYAVATSVPSWFETFVTDYSRTFACKNLGPLALYNGIFIQSSPCRTIIRLSQVREITALLHKFHMHDCNPARTPMVTDFNAFPRTETETAPSFEYPSLIGALLWIARMTRPDILFAVIKLSAFMKTFTEAHVLAGKRILRYLKGTIDFIFLFKADPSYDPDTRTVSISSQSDADWGGDTVTRRSTSGAVTTFLNCVVVVTCRRQDITALSTTEAELIALTEAAKDWLSLFNFITDIVNSAHSPFDSISEGIIETDNIATQFVASNRTFNNRTRHIDMRYMFIRDLVEKQLLSIRYVPTLRNVPDIFTKPLAFDIFAQHRLALGVQLFSMDVSAAFFDATV